MVSLSAIGQGIAALMAMVTTQAFNHTSRRFDKCQEMTGHVGRRKGPQILLNVLQIDTGRRAIQSVRHVPIPALIKLPIN